jgi:hypothetical protein
MGIVHMIIKIYRYVHKFLFYGFMDCSHKFLWVFNSTAGYQESLLQNRTENVLSRNGAGTADIE